MRVGFAGLGIMGTRMAGNLRKAGFETTVWNRSLKKSEPTGLPIASSPRRLAENVDVVCLCLSNPTAVREVINGQEGVASGLRAGHLLIDFSTGTPELAKELAALAAEKGAEFVEAPVTGSKVAAQSGTLLIMAGGSDDGLLRAKPIFEAVGEKTIHCGPVGAASYIKLAGNALRATMLEGFIEGVLLCENAGIDPNKFFEVVQASGNRSPYFEQKGPAVLERQFETHFSVDLMLKDLNLFLETAARHESPSPVASRVRDIYRLAQTRGLGTLDITATVEAIAKA